MSGEPEPRRSVRSTKGQHKALDQLEEPAEPKRRGRKSKKAAATDEKQSSPEEEVIRCVCGATEQDEDSGEPWIACDTCGAWQHNVCMGMSVYGEDIPNEYFCEQCRPEDHKELLEGMAKGERPWEARRKAYEEEQARRKKRGPKKGGKRASDQKDDGLPSSQATSRSAKPSPAPEVKKEPKGIKRKHDEIPLEKESKVTPKMRKVSENQVVPAPVFYNPPDDLPQKISEVLNTRQGPAKAMMKSIIFVLNANEKKGIAAPADNLSTEERAERLALQVERAVHDSHPNQKEYNAQMRTLAFNLKNNHELCVRLLNQTLTPPMLAVMTTDEMASKELQRETAEMKAKAEKQAIRLNEEGPRIRRTHKGDEIVGEDGLIAIEETPSAIRRPSVRDAQPRESPQDEEPIPAGEPEVELPAHIDYQKQKAPLYVDTQQPHKSEFDINKVFSSVRSPAQGQPRRQSQATPVTGPGVDPDVDRMLQDDGPESPPYSPTEESDPDVVWKGTLVMPSVANFQATAKYMGGANLSQSIGLPWADLFPKNLTVAGRIDEQKANEYLCSQRYSSLTDLVIVGVTPTYEPSRPEFQALIDYFVSKKRYGVVGDKGSGNVRDTYLIPVLPGNVNPPEFMFNLADDQNRLPEVRTEPVLLVVFVYKNDAAELEKLRGAQSSRQAQASQSPLTNASSTPTLVGNAGRTPSVSAPAFSPTSPQVGFPPPSHPQSRNAQFPQQQQHQQMNTMSQPAQPGRGGPPSTLSQEESQRQGEAVAREILGPLISSPTAAFLIPQCYQMNPREWEVIKRLYQREPRSRDDLQLLSALLEKEGPRQRTQPQPPLQPRPNPSSSQPASAQHFPPAQQQPQPPPVTAPQPRAGPAIPHKQTPVPLPPIPGMTAPPLQSAQNNNQASRPGATQAAAATPPA